MNFKIRQICMNGHDHGDTPDPSNARASYDGRRVDEHFPTIGQIGQRELPTALSRCPECGEQVLNRCPNCQAYYRGHHQSASGYHEADKYCWQCGVALPWTERRSAAINELIDELQERFPDELPEALAEQLKEFVPDLIAESPRVENAALHFGTALKKLGNVGEKVLVGALVKVVTDKAAELLGLNGR